MIKQLGGIRHAGLNTRHSDDKGRKKADNRKADNRDGGSWNSADCPPPLQYKLSFKQCSLAGLSNYRLVNTGEHIPQLDKGQLLSVTSKVEVQLFRMSCGKVP